MNSAEILPASALPKAAMMRACVDQWERWAEEHAARGDRRAADDWRFQADQLRRRLVPADAS